MAVCSAGMMQQESSQPRAIDATGVSSPPSSGLSLLKRVKEQLRPRVERSKSRGNLLRPCDAAQASTSMESDTDEISEDATTEEEFSVAASQQQQQQQEHQHSSAFDAIAATLQQQYQAAADTYNGMRRRAQQVNPLRLRVARARQHSSYSRAARLLQELPSSQQQEGQAQQQQQQQARPPPLPQQPSPGRSLPAAEPAAQSAATAAGPAPPAAAAAQPPAGPSLPAVTLVVKMLLQLAATKVSGAYASQLRRQLLQQVKQTAAAAKAAGLPFSVPATVRQLLPRLRSEVMAACRQQELAAAVAAAAEAHAAAAAAAQAASTSGVAPVDADACVDVASSDGDDEQQQPSVFVAPCAAAAVETALTTAACEAQLTGLRLSSGPAVLRSVSRPAVDFESLLRAELGAALSADF